MTRKSRFKALQMFHVERLGGFSAPDRPLDQVQVGVWGWSQTMQRSAPSPGTDSCST